jgi:formylglycine-generating enzyme required for sulfatase activity
VQQLSFVLFLHRGKHVNRRLTLGFSFGLLLCSQIASSATPELSRTGIFKDCAECPEMVVIPKGQFVMGVGHGEEEREHLAQEFRNRSEPQRTVEVRRFSIGRYEITRSQYRVFADATRRKSDTCFLWNGTDFELQEDKSWRDPGYAQQDTHPVTCVSWDDATAYAKWLSERTGKIYRLPSEAEWEYATRAGTTTTRFWGDDVPRMCQFANAADLSTHAQVPGAHSWNVVDCNDRYPYTAPVGSFRANAYGLHDVLGNVEEWTQDCWSANYTGAPNDATAATTGDCAQRAVRGGSWIDAPVGIRAAYRVGSPTGVRVYRRGFRVAADM